MKKGLVSVILAGALYSMPCEAAFAEIKFDWQDSPVKAEKRKSLEDKVISSALRYTESKYADFGAYNFVTCSEVYTVRFDDVGQLGEFWIGSKGGTFFFEASLANRPTMLEVVSLHEFCHGYDMVYGEIRVNEIYKNAKTIQEKRQAMDKASEIQKIRSNTENHSKKKEKMFVDEIQNRLSDSDYNELKPRYENLE